MFFVQLYWTDLISFQIFIIQSVKSPNRAIQYKQTEAYLGGGLAPPPGSSWFVFCLYLFQGQNNGMLYKEEQLMLQQVENIKFNSLSSKIGYFIEFLVSVMSHCSQTFFVDFLEFVLKRRNLQSLKKSANKFLKNMKFNIMIK